MEAYVWLILQTQLLLQYLSTELSTESSNENYDPLKECCNIADKLRNILQESKDLEGYLVWENKYGNDNWLIVFDALRQLF